MKKSLFKALLPTMAMILVAVMALTGTTYAWFTTSYTANIDSLDIQVESAANLKIAVMPSGKTSIPYSKWSNTIYWSDIKNSANVYAPSSSGFKATSTNCKTTTGELSFFYAELNEAGSLIETITADNGTSRRYYKFDLYIWNDSSVAKTVTLSGSTFVNASSDASKNVASAMRVATIAQGTAAYTQGNDCAAITTTSTAVTVWEVDGSGHAFGGTATDTYGLSSVGVSGTTYAINSPITNVAELVTGMKSDPKDLSITIAAGEVGKLTVYIWLEGQDCDCINSIANNKVQINLNLEAQ